MSYSFTITAHSVDEALEMVRTKMADVALAQPAHKADEKAAAAMVESYLATLPLIAGKDIQVTCYGSVSGYWAPGGQVLEQLGSCSGSVTVALIERRA